MWAFCAGQKGVNGSLHYTLKRWGSSSVFLKVRNCTAQYYQARNQGGAQGGLENFSLPLEKCAGHYLKHLDIVKKFRPFSENSSPLLVSQAGYGPEY